MFVKQKSPKMNRLLILLIFSVALMSAQNRDLIKDTFYAQYVNGIDKTASENDFAPKERVYIEVDFKADENGIIFDVQVSEDDKFFEEDIKTLVSKIPNLDPKEYLFKGKVMRYKVGLLFKLLSKRNRKKNQDNNEKIKIDIENISIKAYYPIKKIDITNSVEWNSEKIEQYPLTENCKHHNNKDEVKECIANEISSFVNTQFDTSLAAELGLSSNTYKVEVYFIIAKSGEVVNITAEGNIPELREEGIRVINNLPKFKSPAIVDNEPVNLKYVFPIRFMIQ